MPNVKIMTAGDSSILIQFGNAIDPDINAKIAAGAGCDGAAHERATDRRRC